MVLSMTGFGSETVSGNDINIKCEVLCLNKKSLEIVMNLPRNCMFADLNLRKLIEQQIIRGKVIVQFEIQFVKSNKKVVFNEQIYDSWRRALSQLEEEYGSLSSLKLSDWIHMQSVWEIEEKEIDKETLLPLLEEALTKAIKHLTKMRKNEGAQLKKDMEYRLKQIEKILQDIEKTIPSSQKKYEQKLNKLLKERAEPEEQQLYSRFLSIFIEKNDVTEEIVRLNSHINQFKTFIKQSGPTGRVMDFLLQEFLRETNTIGSKISELPVTSRVVEIKALIDQLREQVQNVL